MEIQFYGANCIGFSGKKFNIVIDDNLSELGLKSVTKSGDIVLQTFEQPAPEVEAKIIINSPGEYEVSNISINGVSARSHMDEEGKKSATIYRLVIDDIRVAVVGHIYPELTDDELEELLASGTAILDIASVEDNFGQVSSADLIICTHVLACAGMLRHSRAAYRGAPAYGDISLSLVPRTYIA